MQKSPFKKIMIALLAGIIFFVGGGGEVAVAANTSGTGGPGALNTGAIQQDNSTLGVSCFSSNLKSGNVIPSVDVGGCLAIVTYYAVYKPASIILVASVEIFDAVLTMSIDRTFIEKDFVDNLWKIARDFSNMAFIFILLYAGVQTMLGMGNWQKTVLNVVIIALLINFSLFFTKIIIDAGNILAVGIYSSMGAGTPGTNAWGGTVESRGLGEAVAGAFQPQKFLTVAADNSTDAIIIFIIATIVSILVAWAFFKAAMVFVGRILGFWFLMIVSPFAFISFAFPKGNKFGEWFDALLDQAMVAPVFLFFMYMIMMAVQGGTDGKGLFAGFNANPSGNFFFDKLFIPCMMALLIYMAIKFAVDYAEKTSGAFGKIGAQIAGAVVGVAAGAATGGAAMIGRKAIGGAAQRLEESGALKKLPPGMSKVALNLNDTLRKGTFDVRGSKLGGKAFGALGVDAGKVSKEAKGGYEGMQKAQNKADLEAAKRYSTLTDKEKDSIKAKHAADIEKKKGEAEAKKKEVATHKQTISEHEGRIKEAQMIVDMATKAKEDRAKAEVALKKAYQDGSFTPDVMKALEDASDAEIEAVKNAAAASVTLKNESASLTAAQDALKKAEEAAKNAEEVATSAEETMNKDMKDRSDKRRESYAAYVENRGTAFGVSSSKIDPRYSHRQAHRTAQKIRENKLETKTEDEKMVESLMKKVKEEQAKEDKEKGGDKGKGGEEKEKGGH